MVAVLGNSSKLSGCINHVLQRNGVPFQFCCNTNIFVLLVLKHDRAYLSVSVVFEESMIVIMKCNTVTSNILPE